MAVITLKLKANIEVKFKAYPTDDLNAKAKEQIAIWVEETLKDEAQVPLFVLKKAGEESISKTVVVEIENEN